MKFRRLLFLATILIASGCSSLSEQQKIAAQNELDKMAQTTISELLKKEPHLQAQMNEALAYGVANMKVTKVPVVGVGGGEGVMVIKGTEPHIYFTVKRLDFGAGWGARSYKVLILLNTQELVDDWKDGEWKFEIGAEASAGSAAAQGSSGDMNPEFTLHVLSDGGASATVTARVIRAKVNQSLTD
jgi:lipid-binding SYLF domain-containing protein